ncbi:type II toxin-antitoxin system Phd/YefM family antitoxin [Spirochaetota bacterium]
MTTINVTNARKKLYSLIEDVNSSHDTIHITGKNGSAVILSEDDWNSIEETLHLSSIPGMTESIKKGLAEPINKCSNKLNW